MRTLASRVKGYRLRTGLAMNVSTTLSSIDGRDHNGAEASPRKLKPAMATNRVA
jgi:hypothetical protein